MVDIDKILKLETINNYLLSLDERDRIILLRNDKVRNYYLEEYNNVSGMVNEIISDSKILEK